MSIAYKKLDKIIELNDIIADDNFTFEKGDVNLRMIIKGTTNKPIVNGFLVIKDSEMDIYGNNIAFYLIESFYRSKCPDQRGSINNIKLKVILEKTKI